MDQLKSVMYMSEPNRYIYFCEIIFIRVLLFQMLLSCVGKLYYNILNVYSIKHVVYIYVWFQNNPRQLNISECISNFSYWLPRWGQSEAVVNRASLNSALLTFSPKSSPSSRHIIRCQAPSQGRQFNFHQMFFSPFRMTLFSSKYDIRNTF